MKKQKVTVQCAWCKKIEEVSPSRAKRYKTCSKQCMGKLFQSNVSQKVKIVCGNPSCNKEFEIKKSHLQRRNYCSKKCQAEAYRTRYLGSGNPNHKGILMTSDGYKICSNSPRIDGCEERIYHRFVVRQTIGKPIPDGMIVHHRNCDKLDNEPKNLVMLSPNDHRWLHKQFGNAILWAYYYGKIEKEKLVEWSDNPQRAERLLDLNCLQQKENGNEDSLS